MRQENILLHVECKMPKKLHWDHNIAGFLFLCEGMRKTNGYLSGGRERFTKNITIPNWYQNCIASAIIMIIYVILIMLCYQNIKVK